MATYVKRFYESSMEGIERSINCHLQSSGHDVQSMHVFQSSKNAWYEAIIVFQRPIEIYVNEKPTIISGPDVTTSPPKKP